MAIKLRLLGTVSDAVRSLTFTRSGLPRFSFGVRVGTRRSRHYLITAYGTMARFGDIYLRTGQRVHVEGAYMRRYPAFEGVVRADTIRHIGRSVPPFAETLVRFFPVGPRVSAPSAALRPIPHEAATGDERTQESTPTVDDAIAAAVN